MGSDEPLGRRRFVVAAGSIAGVAALSGCSGAGDTEGFVGSEFPVVEQWLTETEVGGPDDTYDGTVSDGRGREEVRVDVGVDGNGGAYAYDLSAVAVSPGTTVRWVRVDDREGHNVVAAPDRQFGESDYEFRSGGPTIEAGHEFARTLDARESRYTTVRASPEAPGAPAGAFGAARTDSARPLQRRPSTSNRTGPTV